MALRVSVYLDENGEEITNIDFDSPADFAPYAMSAPDQVDLSPIIEVARRAQTAGNETLDLLEMLGRMSQE